MILTGHILKTVEREANWRQKEIKETLEIKKVKFEGGIKLLNQMNETLTF